MDFRKIGAILLIACLLIGFIFTVYNKKNSHANNIKNAISSVHDDMLKLNLSPDDYKLVMLHIEAIHRSAYEIDIILSKKEQ